MNTSTQHGPPVPTGQILATDLDGTLIPLPNDPANSADLSRLASQLQTHDVKLIYITGRHFASAAAVIEEHQLPQPDWLICDVGTSMFHRQPTADLQAVDAYRQHLGEIIADMPIADLKQHLSVIAGLRLQESEKQGPFKLSYYVDAARLEELVECVKQELLQSAAPYSIIHSVDPFNGDGLIDLLPSGVSKAHALAWWVERNDLHRDALVFAGDSGNDLAVLTAGYRAIVVGNADRAVAQQAYAAHRRAGWGNRLYLAINQATSGVWEGCRWFGLVDREESSIQQLGATLITDSATHFRVWAPDRRNIAVEIDNGESQISQELQKGAEGYFTGVVPDAAANARYQYRLDGGAARPDPASRSQPDGVHGPSQIIDPRGFPWSDQNWPGVVKRDLVIYELHVGAFTQAGDFQAATAQLSELSALGVTAVEVMPVAQTSGRWNWGYDGVNLFAVRNTYGAPNDFKSFVDACHAAGMAVILDVVYNHVGPEGNYLTEFGPYASTKHNTPWGDAFNYDEPGSAAVRRFVIDNALFWLDEYHLDGLRLDAAHFIQDDSHPALVDELRRDVSLYAESVDRTIHLIAETNVFDQETLNDQVDRLAFDGIWCDCLMHAIYAHALPDLRIAHREYVGGDLAEVLQDGFVYFGRDEKRIEASQRHDLSRNAQGKSYIESFIIGLQTHDSVGNHPQGQRIHQLTSKAFQKAAAALTLLYPGIPIIFMGEEFAIDAPFPFFVDFEDASLMQAVDSGRVREFPQHVWGDFLLPSQPDAYHQAKHDVPDRRDMEMYAWYRELIALRKQGLAEGWLSADCMTTGYDPQTNIFSLRFRQDSECEIVVQARLKTPSTKSSETAAISIDGVLLLSSEELSATSDDSVVMSPSHVVVSKTSTSRV